MPFGLTGNNPWCVALVCLLIVLVVTATCVAAPRIVDPTFTVETIHGDGIGADHLLERRDGIRIDEGWNHFGTFAGEIALNGRVTASCRLRLGAYPDQTDLEVRRLFLEARWGDWSVGAGRGVERLGQGYGGRLLLDDNAPAFDYVRIRNHERFQLPGSLASWGSWGVEVLNGTIPRADELPSDPRFLNAGDPVANPHLLGMRLDWMPTSWLQLGVTRSALYGGEGREPYDTLGEWWGLFTAAEENAVGGEGGSLDSDQLASIDFVVGWPDLSDQDGMPRAQYYLEHAGTDVYASWQGDDFGWVVPFRLVNVGVLQGVLLATGTSELRVEHARTSPAWYRHAGFPQGYTNGGVSLGHPMGGDARGWLFALTHRWDSAWTSEFAFEVQSRGHSQDPGEQRNQWQANVDWTPDSSRRHVDKIFLEIRWIDYVRARAVDGWLSADGFAIGLGVTTSLGVDAGRARGPR